MATTRGSGSFDGRSRLPLLRPTLLALLASTAACSPEPPKPAPFPDSRPRWRIEAEERLRNTPPPPPPAWTKTQPTETRLERWDGCLVPARRARLALTVDGTEGGVFVSGLFAAGGELSIDPAGTSGARITFGVVRFDTQVLLRDTGFRLPDRPAPLGGIFEPDEHVHYRAVGGTKERLRFTPIDRNGVFLWETPPEVEVACEAMARTDRWSPRAPTPEQKVLRTVYTVPDGSLETHVAVRVAPGGPIVARVALRWAQVVEEGTGWLRIVASTPIGRVTGVVDAAAFAANPPPARTGDGAGSGMGIGFGARTRVSCPFGAPLFVVLPNERLYRVGAVRDATDPPAGLDWRWLKSGVAFDGERSVPGYTVLADELRVTNTSWHDGVGGRFVVKMGEDGCRVGSP